MLDAWGGTLTDCAGVSRPSCGQSSCAASLQARLSPLVLGRLSGEGDVREEPPLLSSRPVPRVLTGPHPSSTCKALAPFASYRREPTSWRRQGLVQRCAAGEWGWGCSLALLTADHAWAQAQGRWAALSSIRLPVLLARVPSLLPAGLGFLSCGVW